MQEPQAGDQPRAQGAGLSWWAQAGVIMKAFWNALLALCWAFRVGESRGEFQFLFRFFFPALFIIFPPLLPVPLLSSIPFPSFRLSSARLLPLPFQMYLLVTRLTGKRAIVYVNGWYGKWMEMWMDLQVGGCMAEWRNGRMEK